MTVTLLPNVEAIVVAYLKSRTEVTALVAATRIGTRTPPTTTTPWVRVSRIGGPPAVHSRPLWLDSPLVQIDAYGSSDANDSQGEARALAETCRAVLAELPTHTVTGAVVTDVSFGSMLRLPDTLVTPARERYVADLTITLHP